MYKKIILSFLLLLVLGVAYYGISPLFKKTSLNDPIPETADLVKTQESFVLSNPTSTEPTPETPQKEVGTEIKTTTPIKGTSGHPASGEVRVIISEKTKIIRYENFTTINGPDLYVYLSKDLQAKDFVSLGKIKATEGNINYEIPKDVNVKDYSYAIVWCKAFGVLFNSADISNLVK